jgi:hypothetical protein
MWVFTVICLHLAFNISKKNNFVFQKNVFTLSFQCNCRTKTPGNLSVYLESSVTCLYLPAESSVLIEFQSFHSEASFVSLDQQGA